MFQKLFFKQYHGDKLYFIPYAQKDIGIFDLKTRTFDQTTFDLGYNGGFYGSVYNPVNKCLCMSRSYKVGASAGWNIPYLDFSSTTPTLGAVNLPSNYVGFRGGTYCPTNGCVYIPMGVTDNGANAYVLKITSANAASALTFGGAVESKQYNSDTTLDTSITFASGRFLNCIDKYGTLYGFSNSAGNNYSVYKFPILVNNKEIFHPTFNCMK